MDYVWKEAKCCCRGGDEEECHDKGEEAECHSSKRKIKYYGEKKGEAKHHNEEGEKEGEAEHHDEEDEKEEHYLFKFAYLISTIQNAKKHKC